VTPGDVAEFSAKGAYAYNNGYWYVRLNPNAAMTRFLYEFEVQYPTNVDLAASQALEFELQQTINGRVYNMAWQAPFKNTAKIWRTFDFANHAWADAKVPLDQALFADGKWVSIAAEYARVEDQVTHVALTINGNRYLVGVSRAGVQRYAATAQSFNAAYQLDSNSKNPPTPYRTLVRNMRVHYF
jgi:hypothetical protein